MPASSEAHSYHYKTPLTAMVFALLPISEKAAFYLMKKSEKEVEGLQETLFTDASQSVQFFKGDNALNNRMHFQSLHASESAFLPLNLKLRDFCGSIPMQHGQVITRSNHNPSLPELLTDHDLTHKV